MESLLPQTKKVIWFCLLLHLHALSLPSNSSLCTDENTNEQWMQSEGGCTFIRGRGAFVAEGGGFFKYKWHIKRGVKWGQRRRSVGISRHTVLRGRPITVWINTVLINTDQSGSTYPAMASIITPSLAEWGRAGVDRGQCLRECLFPIAKRQFSTSAASAWI